MRIHTSEKSTWYTGYYKLVIQCHILKRPITTSASSPQSFRLTPLSAIVIRYQICVLAIFKGLVLVNTIHSGIVYRMCVIVIYKYLGTAYNKHITCHHSVMRDIVTIYQICDLEIYKNLEIVIIMNIICHEFVICAIETLYQICFLVNNKYILTVFIIHIACHKFVSSDIITLYQLDVLVIHKILEIVHTKHIVCTHTFLMHIYWNPVVTFYVTKNKVNVHIPCLFKYNYHYLGHNVDSELCPIGDLLARYQANGEIIW